MDPLAQVRADHNSCCSTQRKNGSRNFRRCDSNERHICVFRRLHLLLPEVISGRSFLYTTGTDNGDFLVEFALGVVNIARRILRKRRKTMTDKLVRNGPVSMTEYGYAHMLLNRGVRPSHTGAQEICIGFCRVCILWDGACISLPCCIGDVFNCGFEIFGINDPAGLFNDLHRRLPPLLPLLRLLLRVLSRFPLRSVRLQGM